MHVKNHCPLVECFEKMLKLPCTDLESVQTSVGYGAPAWYLLSLRKACLNGVLDVYF